MENLTTNQDKNNNPEGKGGFGDNPEHRSDGRWKKENSKSYWLNYFDSLTIQEFEEYPSKNPNMTKAAQSSYARIKRQKDNLREFQEVANRTEGMPKQTIKQEFEDDVKEVKISVKK